MELSHKKSATKCKILSYMFNQGIVSKGELARELSFSMPTVLTNVNEMIEQGLIVDVGEMESTGGRKARMLEVQKNYSYAIGVDITANHIGLVLMNLGGEILKQERVREKFKADMTYCSQLAERIQNFYAGLIPEEKILGVGISLPGIINEKEQVLAKSHALKIENYSLKMLEQMIPFPVYFENDANAAMMAENPGILDNVIYLSLNNTFGGAICVDGELFTGQYRKAAEFGHMILHPQGKTCYCGKQGCADAYCAASVLTQNGKETLDDFMERVGKDAVTDAKWHEYLENLAILISNLRMVFDTDIILGGEVGAYLPEYMVELGERILKHNLFDGDISYLRNCVCKREASAVGVARHFFEDFIELI